MSDMPSREMTLAEWVDRLPPHHRARDELAQLEANLEKLSDDWENLVGDAYSDSELVKHLKAENEELRELFVYFFGENYEELAKG